VRYAAHFYTLGFLERNHVASAILERLWYALSREGLQLIPPQHSGNGALNSAHAKPVQRPGSEPGSPNVAAEPLANAAARTGGGGNPVWKILLGDLLPELNPSLVDRLTASARRYRYGQHETVSPRIAAIVMGGRLREECSVEEIDTDAALQRVLRFGPESAGGESCLPGDKLNSLMSNATQAIGPLAQSLVRGYAAVTDDPWLAYHAIAAGISDTDRRADFLLHSPARPSRGITAGGMLGWPTILGLTPAPIRCHATQDCELLIWNAATLRKVLGSASESELASLVTLLRRHQPGCSELDQARLAKWIKTEEV
jgi:hypothetical protein